MPQVPVYDQPQVGRQVLQGGEQRISADPAAFGATQGQQLSLAGQALSQAADAVSRIDQRNDRAIADSTEATVRRDWIKFDMDARQKYQGNRIGEYKDAAEKWWAEAPKAYGSNLTPRAKSFLDLSVQTAQTQALASSLGHYAQVTDRNQDMAFDGKMNSRMDWAIVQVGTPEAVNAVREEMKTEVAARAAAKGLDTDSAAKLLTAYNSKMTVDFVTRKMRSDPAAAESFLAKSKEDGYISSDAYTSLIDKVEHVSALADGKSKADATWQQFGPKNFNDPVDTFALESKVKALFPNDATRQSAAIASIRETAQAFNASQKEYIAGHTNDIFKMIDSGMPASRALNSDAALALPAKERHMIAKQLEAEAHARESRALTNENRELLRMQRDEKMLMLRNADEYLSFTNPDALAQMTRAQVQASRALFGAEGAKHLLDRWDSLQTANGKVDAKMDKDDFNAIAASMQYNTTPAPRSQEAKDLGDLHYRAEQIILDAQRRAGPKPLSREDKQRIVREEVAKTVMVKGRVYGEDAVSVMKLTPEQLDRVVVPAEARKTIAEKLQQRFLETKDPAYAATEENLRRAYVRNISKVGALIPNAK